MKHRFPRRGSCQACRESCQAFFAYTLSRQNLVVLKRGDIQHVQRHYKRGSSIPLAPPLGLLLLISCYCVLSKSLVRDDSRFSVCYSVTNVLSPLQTLLLPKVRSRLILYSEHARGSKHTHEHVSRHKPARRETRRGN